MNENDINDFDLAAEFIEYWQNFIENWMKFAEKQTTNLREFIGNDKEFSKYGSIYKAMSNYFPEPYLGNPNNLKIKKIHAVFINLNPGGAGPSQSYYEDGGYVRDLKECKNVYQDTLNKWNKEFYSKNISDSAKKNISAYGTLNWWNKYRADWVNSFLKPSNIKYQIEIQHIIGLELSPWHSRKFAEIRDIDIQHAKDIVVDKAVTFSKHINNPYLRNDTCSLVLTCGAGFKNFFKKEEWIEITPTFLEGKWNVSIWKYNKETSIINFHQTNTKGPVKLNFPNDPNMVSSIQAFLSEQLKAMLA